MKDCSNCPDRPAPGADYEKTACASCKPWEPGREENTVPYNDGIFYPHGSLEEWQETD